MEQKMAPSFTNLDLQIYIASYISGDRWWEDAEGKDWWSRRWRPEFDVLYYVKKGRFTLEMEGKRYTLLAGQMVLIPAFTDVRLSIDGAQELEKYYTHFQLLLGKGMLADRYGFDRVICPQDPKQADRLFTELVQQQDPTGFSESGALLQLLGLFFAQANTHSLKNESGLGTAIDYIHAHSAENFSISQLAHLCGYSKDHFTRKFKDAYGRAPRQYIAEHRLRQAKELLAATDRSVAAIAEELGFRSAGYFTNFFCQKTGLSPSCYRKEERLKQR